MNIDKRQRLLESLQALGISLDGTGLMTELEAAKLLKVSKYTVQRWRRDELITYTRRNSKAKYSIDDLLALDSEVDSTGANPSKR